LLKRQYKIGQLSTEPTGYLFGMNYVLPMGYNQNDELSVSDYSIAINFLLGLIDKKQPDIILFGTQSNVVPPNFGNQNYFNIYFQSLMFGSNADACFLCVNNYDSISYVKRSINYIESFSNTKVIGLVLSAFHNDRILFTEDVNIESNLSNVDKFAQTFKLPVIHNTSNGAKIAVDIIENFFSAQN
jgi:uncharacterized NAD-dependent epimerase/dehydratase family protein